MDVSPSRPKVQELSVPCSPVVTKHAEKRTVPFAVDDEEDSRGPTGISPMTNERTKLKGTSFVLNVFEDTSCPTDNSSVSAYARSGE